MTNDNLYTPYRGPKWEIGKLSIGFHSHEDILALAESFIETESFLDAVGYILKRVDVVFGLRPVSAEALQAFLDPPPPQDQVSIVTNKLTAVYMAWQIASELNPAVAAFKGAMLEDLRNEIHRVSRDAIEAVRNGTELQKLAAAHKSRKDITDAFYKMNRELGIHRAKYDLLHRVSDKGGFEHDGTDAGPSVEVNPLKELNAEADPMPASSSTDNGSYLGLVFHHDSTVSRIGSDYKHIPPIQLAPQPLKLLKFIHDAKERGRTVNELVPAIVATKRILTTEKSRLNLSEIDIDLGPTGQYVVRCTRPNAL